MAVASEKGPPISAPRRPGRERPLHGVRVRQPDGPLHVGHGRGGRRGDALAGSRVHGHKIVREYYITTWETRWTTSGRSLSARYRMECGRDAALPETGIEGIMIELARDLRREEGTGAGLAGARRSSAVQEGGGGCTFAGSGGPCMGPGYVRPVVRGTGAAQPWVCRAALRISESRQLYESERGHYFRSQH